MPPKPHRETPFLKLPLRAWLWASYDFANTIFSMNIITLYFAQWVVIDLGLPDLAYGASYSLSMAVVGLTMPAFGAVADARRSHTPHLIGYTVACVVLTAALAACAAIPGPNHVKAFAALAVFAGANYFYIGAQTFYNALLLPVSPAGRAGYVSGVGTALGYLGAIAGLLLVWPFVGGKVPFFAAGRASAFLPTAAFFLLFAFPAWFAVREDRTGAPRPSAAWGFRKAWGTLKRARERPGVFRFLIGNVLLQDPVATAIVFMAIYAQRVFGMADEAKIPLFIVSTTFAIAGGAAAGFVTDRWGARKTTMATAVGWAFTFAFIAAARHPALFWVGGALVGVGLGFTWTATRPFLTALVGRDEQGEFFGLYNLAGRAAAIIGPLWWGAIIWAAGAWPVGKYRLAAASLVVFEVAAFFVFRKIATPGKPDSGRLPATAT